MDPYDPHRHHNHPSDSIPNAAYPDDSSYRPSDSGHELSNLMPASAALQQHSTGSTSPGGSRLTTSPWQPDPLGPPPPYVPSEAPTSLSQQPQSFSQPPSTFSQQPSAFSQQASGYSQPASTFSQTPSSAFSQPPPSSFSQPPAAYSPLNPPSQIYTSSNTNLHMQTPPHSSGGYVPASPYSTHSSQLPPPSPFAGPGKPGPIAQAHARRRRQRRICLMIVAALIVFTIAVVIGVALGVLKVQFKDKDDDDWDD